MPTGLTGPAGSSSRAQKAPRGVLRGAFCFKDRVAVYSITLTLRKWVAQLIHGS